ncbi:uncharacterized protein [Branchiostoma lanceolatum]|uniref:uncharacterized protein n=1 Tax=Branchiostoma lanceolatum TaxID=7740 RepID=UPI0034533FCD
MKTLLITAVTVCLLGVAVCCPPPPPTSAPPQATAQEPQVAQAAQAAAEAGVIPSCPSGLQQVSCSPDPCQSATCAAQPAAICVGNCGSCTAVFYDSNAQQVNCNA